MNDSTSQGIVLHIIPKTRDEFFTIVIPMCIWVILHHAGLLSYPSVMILPLSTFYWGGASSGTFHHQFAIKISCIHQPISKNAQARKVNLAVFLFIKEKNKKTIITRWPSPSTINKNISPSVLCIHSISLLFHHQQQQQTLAHFAVIFPVALSNYPTCPMQLLHPVTSTLTSQRMAWHLSCSNHHCHYWQSSPHLVPAKTAASWC